MNLLTLNYWFSTQPPAFIPWLNMLFIFVFLAMFIVGVVALVIAGRKSFDKFVRRAISKTGFMLIIMGLLGAAWWFFTYERVPVLSIRIWIFPLVLITAFWSWGIYKYIKVEVPAKHALSEERAKQNKWLPKSKK